MFPMEILNLAEKLVADCTEKNIKIATAESCTGGLIAGCLTTIAGSSDVFDRGFVTYSNEAKMEMLAVPDDLLSRPDIGAVSEPVARAMAEGAVKNSRSQLAVAVTGVAGPGGGSAEKPVGLVHLACARQGHETLHRRMTYGDIGRNEIRLATVITALEMLSEQADK